jgi:hypothetical protein
MCYLELLPPEAPYGGGVDAEKWTSYRMHHQ